MSVVKVAGTSLGGITVTGGRVVVQEWQGAFGKTIEAPLPSLVAATWPDLVGVVVPREFTVGLLLIGTSAAAFYSLLDSVRGTVETTATVTLTREYVNLSGTQTKTAKAVYLGGMDPTMASDAVGRCTPRWHLLAEWA